MGFLLVQGGALVIGRGDCPLGPFQRWLGDPVPMFELVLPPRAAKAAIPALLAVTLAAMAAVAIRPPRPRKHDAVDATVDWVDGEGGGGAAPLLSRREGRAGSRPATLAAPV